MGKLVRYRSHPLDFFDEIKEAFRSMFDDFPAVGGAMPAVDVRAEEGRYVIEADLPGMNEEDVDVSVTDDSITISSRKEQEKEEKKEGYLLQERHSASFRRSFRLPSDVDHQKIDATFRDGMLTVTLPRTEAKEPRRIAVRKS